MPRCRANPIAVAVFIWRFFSAEWPTTLPLRCAKDRGCAKANGRA